MHLLIDITTTQDQFAYAGIGQLTTNLVRNLIRSYSNRNTFTLLMMENAPSTLELESFKRNKNVNIEYVGPFKKSSYKNIYYYYRYMFPRIKSLIEKTKSKKDEIMFFSPHYARMFPSRLINTSVFVHDFAQEILNAYSKKSPIHNFVRKYISKFYMKDIISCKYVFTNINHTKTEFLKRYPSFNVSNVIDVPLGINLEEKEIKIENSIAKYNLPLDLEEKGYYIYLGGEMTKTKNTIGVIKGYVKFLSNLSKEFSSPYLIIAGREFVNTSRKEVRSLHKTIEELHLKDKVLFTGYYEDSEKYALLHNSIAFIHLSLYEGFGLALGEAMRSKTAIIASNNDAHKYVLGEAKNGILVDGTDSAQVAKAMHRVFEDRDLRAEIARNAYERSQEFSWDKTARIIGGKIFGY